MMKTYELTIPSWDAVVPREWELVEISSAEGEFQPAVGMQIHLVEGDKIRGLPDEVIEAMLEHDWVKEVDEEGQEEKEE